MNTNTHKSPAPWLGPCCSIKATYQTHSGMVNPYCFEETPNLHVQPLGSKTMFLQPKSRRHLPAHATGHWGFKLEMGHSCCHLDFTMSVHSPLNPAFFFFSFLFFPSFYPILGSKNSCCFWADLQLAHLFTAQHLQCSASAKGVSLCKGFLSE